MQALSFTLRDLSAQLWSLKQRTIRPEAARFLPINVPVSPYGFPPRYRTAAKEYETTRTMERG